MKSLKAGQQVWLSGDASCWVTVERSGNGKTLRYIRNTPNGYVVFRKVAF